MKNAEQHQRQARLTAVLADAAIATPAALDALLAVLYRALPDRLAHVNRVARLSVQVGHELNLTKRAIDDLERAARVHDLGRLVIPDAADDRIGGDMVHLDHPAEQIFACAAMVSVVPFLGRAADIVLASRECIDGSGLPFGLREQAICLEARILHVADAFDTYAVLCSRFAVHPDTVNVELVRHAGTKFDPNVVAACLRCRPPVWSPDALHVDAVADD